MSKRLSWIVLAIAMLFAFNASAARKVAVLMLPQDAKSHASAAKFVEYLEEAVDQHRDCILRRSSDTLGDSTPVSAISARKSLRSALSKAKREINASELDAAEENLRAAMGEFSNAAAAMDRCGEICDTLIHLAGVASLKGEERATREAIKDVLAMDSSFKFDGTAFDKSFMNIYREMKMQLEINGRIGMLSVETTPPGSRVFVDGIDRGFSPVTLDNLLVGRHFVRVERTGYMTYGAMVDVSETGSSTLRPRLQPTEEFSEIADNVDALARDIDRKRGSRALSRVGAKLKVDRALLGTIRSEGGRIRLNLILADFTEQAILSSASRTFQADEYGEIGKEVQRMGTKVINAANYDAHNNEIKSNSTDPLDHRTGMEDWGEEDRSFDQGSDSYSSEDDERRARRQEQQRQKKKNDDRKKPAKSSKSSSSSSSEKKSSRSNSMADEPIDGW